MKKFFSSITKLLNGILNAIKRFPIAVSCLLIETGVVCYTVSIDTTPDTILTKLIYAFAFGTFIGTAVQFVFERFSDKRHLRTYLYILAVVATVGYGAILYFAKSIDSEIIVRTIVAVFALVCIAIWIPSFKGKFNFNSVAMVHLKAILISGIFSVVLNAGISAIIFTIDSLLFSIDTKAYLYESVVIWILFATVYYLSLLPVFNSMDEEMQALANEKSSMPKFIQILISYVAVPLIFIYTAVLISYFVKIGILRTWPVGQLGPMILGYSIAGIVVYVLASLLDNGFVKWYLKIFPIALIPIVIMQLVAVYIRVNSYGITESRYYLIIYGIYSLLIGILLAFRIIKKNGALAVILAIVAIISIIPPVDAFTISRNSQISRLEGYLTKAKILDANKKITPKSNVDKQTQVEVTSILNYLKYSDYLSYVSWLPKDFDMYFMKDVLGFDSDYGYGTRTGDKSASYELNANWLNIEGADVYINTIDLYDNNIDIAKTGISFDIRGEKYVVQSKIVNGEKFVQLSNKSGGTILEASVTSFVKSLIKQKGSGTHKMLQNEMVLVKQANGYTLRIVFPSIYVNNVDKYDPQEDNGMDIYVTAPK